MKGHYPVDFSCLLETDGDLQTGDAPVDPVLEIAMVENPWKEYSFES